MDPNFPSVKRAVAFESMMKQPAEVQKMIIGYLSFREQVHIAAEFASKYEDWTALLLVNDLNAERLYTNVAGSYRYFAIPDVNFTPPGISYGYWTAISTVA